MSLIAQSSRVEEEDEEEYVKWYRGMGEKRDGTEIFHLVLTFLVLLWNPKFINRNICKIFINILKVSCDVLAFLCTSNIPFHKASRLELAMNFSHALYTRISAHLILLDLIILAVLAWVLITLILITHLLQIPVTSYLLPQILLSTLFSDISDPFTNVTLTAVHHLRYI
jgi:hypothetical protein